MRARVLLVDDDLLALRAVARMLGAQGFDVTQVSGAADAMLALGKSDFDVVVSDIAMPGMNGIQLLRAARDRDPDVPVVLVTGSPAVQSAIDAIQYGAFRYLTKPVDSAELCATLDRATRLHRIAIMKREAFRIAGQHTAEASDRAGLEASFDRALATLWVAFQPIVRASDRSLFGYEALLRSPEPTLPNPGAVLAAGERLNRLPELGRAVRDAASRAMHGAPAGTHLFVNLHTKDLMDESLASLETPLASIAPRVVLEITERASLDEVTDVRARVSKLRERGYRIAIDDLGAGYAGLTSFAQLEPEIVKLDMSLIRDVHKQPMKQKLIRSMTSLCKDMGMLVVAEGIETLDEREALIGLGCDLLQGYLLAKPAKPFPTFTW